jgi:hypothetical protein
MGSVAPLADRSYDRSKDRRLLSDCPGPFFTSLTVQIVDKISHRQAGVAHGTDIFKIEHYCTHATPMNEIKRNALSANGNFNNSQATATSAGVAAARRSHSSRRKDFLAVRFRQGQSSVGRAASM